MYYSPHILQIRIDPVIQYDESGNPSVFGTPERKTIERCRCDDNTTKEFSSENGHVYRPKYHVVYEGERIEAGAYARCLNDDGSIRGEGQVYQSSTCNYLVYSEIWM